MIQKLIINDGVSWPTAKETNTRDHKQNKNNP